MQGKHWFRRRGQLQISFHFVFALVGGFLFLLFFFILIQNVLHGEQSSETRQLSFTVESLVKTAMTTPDTFRVTRLPTSTYRFVCEEDAEGRQSYVRIGDASYESTETLLFTPIFAPRRIHGDKLFALSRTWNAPFPVGNFLYVANNRTRFIFVVPQGMTSQLRSFLEESQLDSFNIEVMTPSALSTVEDEGFDQDRFVFFTGGPDALPSSVRTAKNSALVVETVDFESGQFTFYDHLSASNNQADASFTFYGEEMLLAAIFAGTSTLFQCNMGKATSHLTTTIDILLRRTATLENSVDDNTCLPLLTQGEGFLNNYKRALSSGMPSSVINKLESLNTQLLANECPLLY